MTITYNCDNLFGYKEELYDNIRNIIGQDERYLDMTMCDRLSHSVIIVEKVKNLQIQERESGKYKEILIWTSKGIIKIWKNENENKTYVTIHYNDKEIYPTQITFRFR